MWNGMLNAWYDDFFASLPFCLLVCYVWTLPLRWSSTLLVWAYARTPGSCNDNGDAAAWWIGWVLGPLWGPSLKDFIIYVSLFWTRPSLIICFFFQCTSVWAVWSPFFVIWVYLTYGIPLYPKLCTLWIFMYVMFYQFEVIQFLGRYN